MMEHFNSILFHKSGPANKHNTCEWMKLNYDTIEHLQFQLDGVISHLTRYNGFPKG